MSPKKDDLRVRRTRVLLKQALIDLCEEKSFKEISVGEIAARAMINRATFYRHYNDKYELARKVFDDAIVDMETSMGPPRTPLAEIDMANPPLPFVRFFQHIATNSRLYTAMLGSDGDPWFISHVREHLVAMFDGYFLVRERLGLMDLPEGMPRKAALNMLSAFLVGTIGWWLEDGTKYSPSQVAEWSRLVVVKGFVRERLPKGHDGPPGNTTATHKAIRRSPRNTG